MRITTTYKTNHNGTGQILAKGGGKQRTVQYDQEHSPDWNHGEAAGTLALVLVKPEDRQETARTAFHKHNGNGSHTFTI